MKTVADFISDWKVYGDTEEFVAALWSFQSDAYASGVHSQDAELERLRNKILTLEKKLQSEMARLDWLLPRQCTHQTRESIDLELI